MPIFLVLLLTSITQCNDFKYCCAVLKGQKHLKVKRYVICQKKDFQVAEAILNQSITCQTNVNKANVKQNRTFLKPLGLK